MNVDFSQIETMRYRIIYTERKSSVHVNIYIGCFQPARAYFRCYYYYFFFLQKNYAETFFCEFDGDPMLNLPWPGTFNFLI